MPEPVTGVVFPTSSPTASFEDEYTPGLTEAEADTLDSLEQIDSYPLYTMSYFEDYTTVASLVDDFRKVQAVSKGDWACSLFTALADPGNRLYGRNFDWSFSPGLLLFTNPPDGFESVSMVNLSFLGYQPDNVFDLTDQPIENRKALLAAPYWPFDGFNQMGLAIGMAAVPNGEMRPDPQKPTLGSLGIIREVLDHAADVDEAVRLFEGYNIDFSGGPAIHYLLSDRGGNAALVEYSLGEIHIIRNQEPWHQATNFILSTTGGDVDGRCHRYDNLSQTLVTKQGFLGPRDALDLLAHVSQDSTQWSIVYNMSTGDVQIAMGLDYSNVHNLLHVFDDQ